MRAPLLSSLDRPRTGWIALLGSLCVSTLLLAQPPHPPADLAAEGPGATDSDTTDPLPISRIILFNSGLAQIVHQGQIEGSTTIRMKFSDHDIDDVLKSIVFDDRGGGHVRAVEYKPSPDKRDVAARTLGPPLTMAQTLQKYRGETVTLRRNPDQTITGHIFAAENRLVNDAYVETLILHNPSGFSSIPLNEILSIQFDDPELREHFSLAMTGLAKSREADLKQIELVLDGQGTRTVRYSYTVDAPIWRMTYRLDLNEETATLQGWAHIDNVTGVDWKNIQLELRSGRPQSFHVSLFAPVLAERSSVELGIFDVPTDTTLIPQYFASQPRIRLSGSPLRGRAYGGGGFGGRGGGFSGGGFGGGGFGSLEPGAGTGYEESELLVTSVTPFEINDSLRLAASTDRTNQMVRFAIKELVSLPGGRSAMVPVMKIELPSAQFTMLQPEIGGTGDLIAAITNNSNTPLIPGPVAVYADGNFIGDAVLGRVEIGQIHELVYGTDLAVDLKGEDLPARSRVVEVTRDPEHGITVQRSTIHRVRYTLRNKDSIARHFLLMVDTEGNAVDPKPTRQRDTTAFYEIECDPASHRELILSHTEMTRKTYTLRQVSRDMIAIWKRDAAKVDEALAATLAALFSQQDRIAQLKVELSEAISKRNAYIAEQERLTRIIEVLKPESKTAEPYLEKLTQNELLLEQAVKHVDDLNARLREAQDTLKTFFDTK